MRSLAQDQRRLREQLDEILDLIGPKPGAANLPASARPRDRWAVSPDEPLWKRASRFVLRSTLGLARSLWRASDPAVDRRLQIEPAAAPATVLPRLGSDYLTAGGDSTVGLPAARLELARLTLASEELAFLEIPSTPGESLLYVERRLWHPAAGIDRGAFAKRRRVGKVVGGRSTRHLDGLRAVGEYRVDDRRPPRRHQVRSLEGLALPGGDDETTATPSPAVLILLTAPLAGGFEQAVGDLVRELGNAFRCVVATTVASDALQDERCRGLEHLAPHVYPLADYLPRAVLPSAVGYLVRRHRVAAVVHLGGDLPEELSQAVRAQPEAPPVLERPPVCGVRMPPDGGGERRAALRRTLGVGGDQLLVVMAGDLVARKRPEDFLALAHRLRDDRRFAFVLAGRGPLAGTVDDLERYLAPPGFRRLEAPVLAELLAAADVACTTSEDEALPYFPLAALAAGLPVVAGAVDGLAELLADGPCGAAVPVADLAAFETALCGLTDAGERRRLGDNGRRLVERRFRLEEAMRRCQDLLRDAPR